jgi:hypothetical protein
MWPDLTIGKHHSDALRIPSNARLGDLATSNEQSRDTEERESLDAALVADECMEKRRKLDLRRKISETDEGWATVRPRGRLHCAL